jgi:hypothetical protein
MGGSQELAIITQTYDLLVWTLGHTAKFSRAHRHGLGYRLENALLDFHDLLIEAKFSAVKAETLRQAGFKMEQSRALFRLVKDLRLIGLSSHEHASRELMLIARQLSGWRRSVENRP